MRNCRVPVIAPLEHRPADPDESLRRKRADIGGSIPKGSSKDIKVSEMWGRRGLNPRPTD